MLGIFSILAIDERPTLGLMRFKPDWSGTTEPPELLPNTAETESSLSQVNPNQSDHDDPMDQAPISPENVACFDIDITTLDTCCDQGSARCVDEGDLPDRFAQQLSTCSTGGLCVPESILTARGEVAPKRCSSVGGIDGACLSKCLPEVASSSALLPQDLCESDARNY